MRRLHLALVFLTISLCGCAPSDNSETGLVGYKESDDLPEMKITFEVGEAGYGQCEIDHIGNYRTSDILDFGPTDGLLKTSGDGSIIAYSDFVELDHNAPDMYTEIQQRKAYIFYIKNTGDGWVNGEIGPLEPVRLSMRGIYASDFALAPDGKTGLLSYFTMARWRYDETGKHENPTTYFAELDFENNEYRELPNQPVKGAFLVYFITDSNRILVEACIDSFGSQGELYCFRDYMCSCDYEDLANDDSSLGEFGEVIGLRPSLPDYWRFVRTCRNFPRGILSEIVFNDNGELLVLYRAKDQIIYKSYSHGAEIITEVFRTDLDFYTACTTHDGKTVVGIVESDPDGFIIYQINTERKEYGTYEFDENNENIDLRKIKLLAAHNAS